MVVVDKPAGMTSHDVVDRCRRVFGQRRIGHGGTLDPDATGVLLVVLGRATRLVRFLSELPKAYAGEVMLGVATSTLDAAGEVTGRWDMSGIGLDDVRRAAASLVGEIDQLPPMVSAVKVGGRRLHELARAGVEVDRRPRRVRVDRFDLEPGAEPDAFRMEVECSSGTYVRSLAADLGAALGGGAHLRRLRRTAIGPFREDEARPLAEIGPGDVRPPAEVMRGRPFVTVDGDLAAAVGHGAVFDRPALGVSGEGPWAVVDREGALLAVYEASPGGRAKPSVVLA